MKKSFLKRLISPRPNFLDSDSNNQQGGTAKNGIPLANMPAPSKETPLSKKLPLSKETPISKDLASNLSTLKNVFHQDRDVVIREFLLSPKNKKAFVISIDGITDLTVINENILGKLMVEVRKVSPDFELNMENIRTHLLTVNGVSSISTIENAISNILEGNSVLFLDGETTALSITAQAWEHRGVEKPQTENVVRGPHEAFSESIKVNIGLVRKRIKNPSLRVESMKVGRQTRTDICMVYIQGIAQEKVIQELKDRIGRIDLDAVLTAGYLEDFISDAPFSIFPTVGNTETSDTFAAKILEGRVGVFCDGSPIALTVPFLFVEGMHVREDYYSRPYYSTFIRFLRAVSWHASIFLPSFYVAIIGFQLSVLPKRLLFSIAQSRAGIPFPAWVEALLMMVIWEILKEAGVRIPKPAGASLSIVGALIIGEVAVSANLVGSLMVIIIAATGLMGYLVNPQIDAITLLRYPVLLASSLFGLYGLYTAYLFIIVHMASLQSFGVPYMSPIMPFEWKDMKDFIIRVPWFWMKTRPRFLSPGNPVRVADNPVRASGGSSPLASSNQGGEGGDKSRKGLGENDE